MNWVANSVELNLAADAMWKWEQTGRTNRALWEEAQKRVISYCETHGMPGAVAGMIHDAIQITVRIAAGFPAKGTYTET